jgi:3-isopropylmalate/(R)-2-methylmalate dehydratase small subunit
MKPFTTVTSVALPLLEDRIDTDILFPARFLLLMQRDGLGDYFCRDRRIDPDGVAIPGNPVDDPHNAGARIVLAGEDFGCGSSREQAVWALAGFGIRCVIAPSFGEIFAANCLRNGVLAITLPRESIGRLAETDGCIAVDLEAQTVGTEAETLSFSIPPANRLRLLNGWDDIDLILEQEGEPIAAFEEAQQRQQPWLYEKAT